MFTKIILASIFLLSISAFCQVEQFSSREKNYGEVVYSQDIVNFFSIKEGQTRVDLFVQVPYKNLQFVKSDDGFTAKYEVTASIYDSSQSKLFIEKTWSETINVIDYNMATTKGNYNITKKSFDLTPGAYFIKTTLEDLDSRKTSNQGTPFIVKDLNEKISFSDILLVTSDSSAATNNSILPNVSRNILSTKDKMELYFEVKSKDTTEASLLFEYKIANIEDTVIQKSTENRVIKPGLNQILYTMPEFPLELGAYTITISVSDSIGQNLSTIKKNFYSRSKGLPYIITDIDKAIEQTRYIASSEELDYMEEGKTQAEKTKRFLEFWKKKDPSPNNDENEIFDEYYRRVAYANANFSNYREGWISDRGMVLILLGVPNNVDRHPFEYDSKPYEIWEYYNINKSFIFLDETGFGDYRLMTPLTGDLYRYRY